MMGVGSIDPCTGIFIRRLKTDGPLIYLNANPDVQIILDRIPDAGGTITVPKTMISMNMVIWQSSSIRG